MGAARVRIGGSNILGAAAVGVLALTPISISAQGAAEGRLRNPFEFGYTTRTDLWDADKFTWTRTGSAGQGSFHSVTVHGPDNTSEIFEAFESPGDWVGGERSDGDSEVTVQKIHYRAAPELDDWKVILPRLGTESDSQAVSGASGPVHWAYSYSDTAVFNKYRIQRRAGGGLVPLPQFQVRFRAPAGAIILQTTEEGRAQAEASFNLYLIGKIKNLRQEGSPLQDLFPINLQDHAITGNTTWGLDPIDHLYFFKLPEWTRLRDAEFELWLGMGLEMWTYAEARPVPEPAALSGLAFGVAALSRKRRRR